MKITILDAATLGDDVSLKGLAALGDLALFDTSPSEILPTHCRDATVLITNKVRLDRQLLEAAPSLKLICVAATGTDNIDIATARRLGIAVTNVAGYSTPSVVQHTLSMVLWQAGNPADAHRHVQSGAYTASGLFTWTGMPFDELSGQHWGIIGMGAIGRSVARAATALGCTVSWCSASGSTRDEAWPRLSLEALLAQSDIISLHAPLTEQSRGLIGEHELSLCRPHARLYNLSRGGLVDEDALVRALESGLIASAGLDVYSREPLPLDSPLLRINDPRKLLLTPHMAWSSRQSRQRLVDGMAANIRAWLAGERLNRVD